MHTVGAYNYGYAGDSQDVQIRAGETKDLNVVRKANGAKVNGPFADVEFKGDPRAAVFLNGTTPAYFVGHVDEFDWDWIWHQRLLVQPGTYHVTVKREGNTIWSGEVSAKAGQKVIVHLDRNGQMETKEWKEGNKLGPQPRFRAGIASATVPIAPVTADLAADSGRVSCGGSANVKWTSTDAADTSISGLGSVPGSGERTVTPTRPMTYVLTAKGPGGEATKTVTVEVNAEPAATLAVSQPEICYHKIGDKVVEQGSATLNWSVKNADSAQLDPFGKEAMNGSQKITAEPNRTSAGAIDENLTYTLTAENECGGKTTKTATVRVVGSIDPPPATTLASLFYPTAYPTGKHPQAGLVASETRVLDRLAAQFGYFGKYEQNAKLVIVGHADVRGSSKYNQELSERRVELIKEYLESKGVRAGELETRAEGKQQEIDRKTVEALQARDAQKPEKWMSKHEKATWLAYNRRVDIVLEPTGQESTKAYPNDAVDARLLWQRREPKLKAVTAASQHGVATGQTSANLRGN